MSEEQSAHHTKNEIIIIKRRGGDDHDAHHGGVWKIAYADFMTAMMAFFLVMWLVNAANDQTKAAVASYFNPIKLVDQKPTDKGIKDDGKSSKNGELSKKAKTPGTDATAGDGGQTGRQEVSVAGDKTKYSEADYFKNPYSVLSDIAEQTGSKANVSSAGDGGARTSGPATGASGGKAYRDPFDPDFWTQQVQTVRGKQIQEKDIAAPVPGSTASGNAAHLTAGKSKPAAHSAANRGADPAGRSDTARQPSAAAPAELQRPVAKEKADFEQERRNGGGGEAGRSTEDGEEGATGSRREATAEGDRRSHRRDRRKARAGDKRQSG